MTVTPLVRTSVAVCALLAMTVTGCATGGDGGASGTHEIAVHATDTACELDVGEVAAGSTTLDIHNAGSKVTEVYVLRADKSIVAERENIGPGTSAKLTVELKAGDYVVRCKPGMAGDGIAADLKVTGSAGAAAPTSDPRLEQVVTA